MTTGSTLTAEHVASAPKLETAGLAAVVIFAAAVPLSIAVAQVVLTLSLGLWVSLLVIHHERPELPPLASPLLAYAAVTLFSVALSFDPVASLIDAREVLLFLVIPVVYRFARGPRASTVATVMISVGAATAVIGIVQYGILEFDSLGQRPRGSMGHYMTYSGLLMLVICMAAARVFFGAGERLWSALFLPALGAALALTLTRSAWVGAVCGVGLLLALKDRRLLAAAPIALALVFLLAPASVTDRVVSMFDLTDPTNRDRVAMARAGMRIIADHPIAGVGPDMVLEVYGDYRDADAINETNPHLHNVPLQIAAERGLPALAVWLWFVAVAVRELWRQFGLRESRALAAGALAAMMSMLAAGMFEYNFGDSEFLMLFLVVVTLPAAAAYNLQQPESPAASA
jgi:O-antigen ligase